MRPFLLTQQKQKAVDELVSFASKRENWYKPGESNWIPGNRPSYTIELDSFRCVFTWDEREGVILRHLSISVPEGVGFYPDPIVAFTIAKMFGFTGGKEHEGVVIGPGKDWMCGPVPHENCVAFVQPIKE